MLMIKQGVYRILQKHNFLKSCGFGPFVCVIQTTHLAPRIIQEYHGNESQCRRRKGSQTSRPVFQQQLHLFPHHCNPILCWWSSSRHLTQSFKSMDGANSIQRLWYHVLKRCVSDKILKMTCLLFVSFHFIMESCACKLLGTDWLQMHLKNFLNSIAA